MQVQEFTQARKVCMQHKAPDGTKLTLHSSQYENACQNRGVNMPVISSGSRIACTSTKVETAQVATQRLAAP